MPVTDEFRVQNSGLKKRPIPNMDSAGFSLAELVIAMFLTGLVVLGAASLSSTPIRFQRIVNERLTDVVSSEISMGQLANRLERSSVMKTGLVRCTGFTGLKNIRLSTDGHESAFAYSQSSVLAVRSPDGERNTLAFLNVEDFHTGGLLFITDSQDGSRGGFFSIRSFSKDTLRAEIEKFDGHEHLDKIDCRITNNLTMADIFEASGEQEFIASVVAFNHLKYGTDQSGAKGPTGEARKYIEQTLWPLPDGNELLSHTDVLFYNPNFLQIEQTWKADEFDYDVKTLSGHYNAMITAEVTEKKDSIGSSNQRFVDKVYRAEVFYQLQALKRQNVGVPTTALPAELQFPTCFATASRIVGGFRRGYKEDGKWNYEEVESEPAIFYKIEGGSAGIDKEFAPQINVSFQAQSSGSDIHCYRLNDPRQVGTEQSFDDNRAPDFFQSGKLPMLIGRRGQGGVINLPNISPSSVEYATYICRATGSIQMTASLSYFNPDTSEMSSIVCTGDEINESLGTLRFDGSERPSCTKSGFIDLGGQLMDGSKKGPPLRIAGCYWSDRRWQRRDCDRGKSDPTLSLEKVDVYPYGVEISGVFGDFRRKSTGRYEIDCD